MISFLNSKSFLIIGELAGARFARWEGTHFVSLGDVHCVHLGGAHFVRLGEGDSD